MTLETDAQDFITHWEGDVLTVYKDIGGRLTVGRGHLITDDDNLEFGEIISQEESDDFFADDFQNTLHALDDLVTVELSDSQSVALLDFIFNLGAENLKTSTLLAKLNQSDYHNASLEFPKWDHCNHIVSEGLLNRRLAEQKLFTSTLDNS